MVARQCQRHEQQPEPRSRDIPDIFEVLSGVEGCRQHCYQRVDRLVGGSDVICQPEVVAIQLLILRDAAGMLQQLTDVFTRKRPRSAV